MVSIDSGRKLTSLLAYVFPQIQKSYTQTSWEIWLESYPRDDWELYLLVSSLLSTCLQTVLLEKLVPSNGCQSLFPFLPSGKLHWSSISAGRKSSHTPVYCPLSSFSEIQIVVELVKILKFFIVRCSGFMFEVKTDTSIQVFLDLGFVRLFSFLCSWLSYLTSCDFLLISNSE